MLNNIKKINYKFNEFIKKLHFPLHIVLVLVLLSFFISIVRYDIISKEFFIDIVECTGNSEKQNNNVSINANFKISLKGALAITGLGYGISKIVKVVPPQTKAAVALGSMVIVGTSYITNNYFNNNNNNIKNTDKDNISNLGFNDYLNSLFNNEYFNSLFNNEYFNSLPQEKVLLYCCLIFILIAIYFIIGIAINFIFRYLIDTSNKKINKEVPVKGYRAVALKIINYIFLWTKSSSNIVTFIIFLFIFYSLFFAIYILLYLLNQNS